MCWWFYLSGTWLDRRTASSFSVDTNSKAFCESGDQRAGSTHLRLGLPGVQCLFFFLCRYKAEYESGEKYSGTGNAT